MPFSHNGSRDYNHFLSYSGLDATKYPKRTSVMHCTAISIDEVMLRVDALSATTGLLPSHSLAIYAEDAKPIWQPDQHA